MPQGQGYMLPNAMQMGNDRLYEMFNMARQEQAQREEAQRAHELQLEQLRAQAMQQQAAQQGISKSMAHAGGTARGVMGGLSQRAEAPSLAFNPSDPAAFGALAQMGSESQRQTGMTNRANMEGALRQAMGMAKMQQDASQFDRGMDLREEQFAFSKRPKPVDELEQLNKQMQLKLGQRQLDILDKEIASDTTRDALRQTFSARPEHSDIATEQAFSGVPFGMEDAESLPDNFETKLDQAKSKLQQWYTSQNMGPVEAEAFANKDIVEYIRQGSPGMLEQLPQHIKQRWHIKYGGTLFDKMPKETLGSFIFEKTLPTAVKSLGNPLDAFFSPVDNIKSEYQDVRRYGR